MYSTHAILGTSDTSDICLFGSMEQYWRENHKRSGTLKTMLLKDDSGFSF